MGHQRLEPQPGALVTEEHGRSETRTFQEFLAYFERMDPSVPMVRFLDAGLEAAVQRTSDEVDALVWAHAEQRSHVAITSRTRLINQAAATQQFELGEWLGRYRVPTKVAKEPVTVVRSVSGAGLSCAPSLSRRRFADPLLQQGDEGAALLAVLGAFEKASSVEAAVMRLKKAKLDPQSAREVIEHLAAGRFLQPA